MNFVDLSDAYVKPSLISSESELDLASVGLSSPLLESSFDMIFLVFFPDLFRFFGFLALPFLVVPY